MRTRSGQWEGQSIYSSRSSGTMASRGQKISSAHGLDAGGGGDRDEAFPVACYRGPLEQ